MDNLVTISDKIIIYDNDYEISSEPEKYNDIDKSQEENKK
jgi:hypothetical protein